MDKEKVYNEAVGGDEGFAAGDGYPSCDGEPCANVTDESSADADTMAGDRNTPKAASEELPSRDWEAEIAEWQDKYLRLQAEFDNFRKRTLHGIGIDAGLCRHLSHRGKAAAGSQCARGDCRRDRFHQLYVDRAVIG